MRIMVASGFYTKWLQWAQTGEEANGKPILGFRKKKVGYGLDRGTTLLDVTQDEAKDILDMAKLLSKDRWVQKSFGRLSIDARRTLVVIRRGRTIIRGKRA